MPEEPETKPEAKSKGPHKPTILIVDDEPFVRDALERLLRAKGYDVAMPVAPPYGHGALKLLRTETIDAVILDLELGDDFDGFEVARSMRDHKEWRSIPIVISSGMDTRAIQERAHEYVFHGMTTINLGKPVDVEVLFKTLAALVKTP